MASHVGLGAGLLNNERGIALLLTLVVLVLLVVVILEFDYGTKINLITAGNFRDDVRATYLAKSGVTAARAILKDDAEEEGTYDALTEFWAQPILSYPVGDGSVSIQVTDEAGKIDINRLGENKSPPGSGDDTRTILVRLFTLLEVDPALVDPIQDWVDPDDDQDSFNGAEDSYYQRLDPPYHCKNAPMDTLSELLLVRGISPEIYQRISPYLTTVSVKTSSGNGLINLNTADLPVLQALDQDIDLEFAKRIRDGRPYEKTLEFYDVTKGTSVAPLNSVLRRQIGVKSNYFTVRSRAAVNETEKIITAMIQRDGKKMRLLSWHIY